MSVYRSFIVNNKSGVVSGDITIKNSRTLPPGDVLIKVIYSSLNYLDALILAGDKSLVKQYPHTPGMDAAGIVVESSSSDFTEGDEVIVTNCGLGIDIPGGFGNYIRVPSESILPVPIGLSMKNCMTIGSDGITAAFAVMEIMATCIFDKDSRAVVTGGLFGSGCIAAAILAKCGFNVTAVIKDISYSNFVKTLGVSEIISYENFLDKSSETILPEKYEAGIDTLGGDFLSTIIRSLSVNGSVAVCSSALSEPFTISSKPFVCRGVNILGIDIMNSSLSLQKTAWYRLAEEWYLKVLPMLCTEISLAELPEYGKKLLNGDIIGRIIINHEL